ncbi:DUF1385 domain-containing protein [Candidatus Woesearchaeota archaeon]|nr:DUF1385 domain-containing protein [Candidatus Woesearchaeota archaeon]
MGDNHNIGGQAVIEGVLIKSPKKIVIAVRKPDNKIVLKKEKSNEDNSVFFRIPFIRGIFKLIFMVKIGIDAITWSGNQVYEEQKELTKKEIFLIVVSSLFLSLVFFTFLPYLLTSLKIGETTSPLLFNMVDGILKIIIFIIYILTISLMPDVKRLFEYHGAEHKTVNCYESGKKLTVKNIKKFSRIHTRCGTHFLMSLFIISVLVFSVLPNIVMYLFPGFLGLNLFLQKIILFVLRILFIPIVAAVSYESLKFNAKHYDNILIKFLSQPGLLLQRLTTKEPDNKQIEVAIKALDEVVA